MVSKLSLRRKACVASHAHMRADIPLEVVESIAAQFIKKLPVLPFWIWFTG
jgi:hypothetical protein